MEKGKIIELSHKLIPGKENFKLEINVDDVTKILPEVTHPEDSWYILGEVTMCTHVGTHIEFPYHHWKEGADAMDYPIDNLIGEGIVLDFFHKSNDDSISLEEIKNSAGRIRKNDMIFFRTGMDEYFRTDNWKGNPYLEFDAAEWLISEFNPKIIGTDAWGLEDYKHDHDQVLHTLLFKNNIAMIESTTNLELIGDSRADIFILPLAIKGIDACPVRIVAVLK